MIDFFKNHNTDIQLIENINNLFFNKEYQICKIPNCKYLINYNSEYCPKHIILKSLKKHLYLKLVNDVSIEIPNFIYF